MGIIMTADAAERDRRPIDAWCAAPGGHTYPSICPPGARPGSKGRSEQRAMLTTIKRSAGSAWPADGGVGGLLGVGLSGSSGSRV